VSSIKAQVLNLKYTDRNIQFSHKCKLILCTRACEIDNILKYVSFFFLFRQFIYFHVNKGIVFCYFYLFLYIVLCILFVYHDLF